MSYMTSHTVLSRFPSTPGTLTSSMMESRYPTFFIPAPPAPAEPSPSESSFSLRSWEPVPDTHQKDLILCSTQSDSTQSDSSDLESLRSKTSSTNNSRRINRPKLPAVTLSLLKVPSFSKFLRRKKTTGDVDLQDHQDHQAAIPPLDTWSEPPQHEGMWETSSGSLMRCRETPLEVPGNVSGNRGGVDEAHNLTRKEDFDGRSIVKSETSKTGSNNVDDEDDEEFNLAFLCLQSSAFRIGRQRARSNRPPALQLQSEDTSRHSNQQLLTVSSQMPFTAGLIPDSSTSETSSASGWEVPVVQSPVSRKNSRISMGGPAEVNGLNNISGRDDADRMSFCTVLTETSEPDDYEFSLPRWPGQA